jgi:hypothetical protein
MLLVLAGMHTACGDSATASASGGDAGAGGNSDAAAPDGGGAAPDVPLIPIGDDAYTQWDRLPAVRVGQRAYMRSTYDRSGANEAADASHFLRQEGDDFNVTLDTAGPGVLAFVRTNHWHGSPWHYRVDGADSIVQESSTATPTNPVSDSVFIPESAFPAPLALTWSTTKGADLSWVSVPFEDSFTLAYGRTHYGTGYYIYQLFPRGATNLSRPIESFTLQDAPERSVLDLLAKAGSDIAPTAGLDVHDTTIDVAAGATATAVDLENGPAVVRALRLTIAKDQALNLSRATLRATWDDRSEPSIQAPVALLFGTGSLYNRANAEYLVKGLLTNVQFTATEVSLSIYFPMPFFRRAHLEIVAAGGELRGLRVHARSQPYSGPSNWVGYFHATHVDHGTPVPGEDLVVLDTTNTEGGGSFCGSFVGMSWIFSDRAVLSTLEGDPRFFFDDSRSPQAYGTGTEEWGGGGDYWGGETMTLPLAGHPVGAASAALAHNAEDQIESAYRVLIGDLMPFGKNARIQLEHGGANESSEHYQSVAYWYGLPGECLTLSDEFHVGDSADEALHAYVSPSASAVDSLTTKYELGVQSPESTDTGRHMKGDSEFTMKLEARNKGALLRRKLDYGYPDQRAEVYVADDAAGATFAFAGVWYLAGSNRCIYSNPPGELDPPLRTVQTSERRWREDEFLIPRSMTEGRASIRVRIHFVPTDTPLYPGDTSLERAWSEYRYWLYSYVLPE